MSKDLGGVTEVVKAAFVAIIASGLQRKLRPSQIATELFADGDIRAAMQAAAPAGDGERYREALEGTNYTDEEMQENRAALKAPATPKVEL